MTTMTTDSGAIQQTQRTEGQALIARIRFLIAMAASALIFWHVGWAVVGPADPNGPVTLLTLEHSVVGMAELFGLAVASAGLATAICGARSAHRGPMAVAVGLAALALRGGFIDEFMRRRIAERLAAPAGASVRAVFPRGEFIAETWLWIVIIGVGFIVGRWVESWYTSDARPEPVSGGEPAKGVTSATPPGIPTRVDAPLDSAAEVRQGLGALVLNVLLAYNLIMLLGGRTIDELQKGQIYASIAGAFFISTLVSHLCFRATSRVWLLVAAAVVSTTAYVWNAPSAAELSGTGYVVLPPLLRALPIEYAALSVIGALAGFNFRERLTAGTAE